MRANDLLAWIWLPCLAACADSGFSTPTEPWGVPITGGTMLVTRDGTQAVIADPDRDRVVSVDLARGEVVGEIALLPGDEPGRLVEDGAGRIHVALRHGGAVVTLAGRGHDELVGRRAVCPEPRGVAWQRSGDLVHVACADGDLVTLPAAGGGVARRLRLDRDLRDVVVSGERLVVSRFRTAELLTLDASGAIVARERSPNVQRLARGPVPVPDGTPPTIPTVDAVAAVAWRTIALPDGRIAMLHQRQVQGVLDTEPGGYGGGCEGPVETAVSTFRPGESAFAVRPLSLGAVTVDVAVSPRGDRIAFATAGTREVRVESTAALADPDGGDDCRDALPDSAREPPFGLDTGAPTALAYTPAGELAVFYPEVPALVVDTPDGTRTIALPGEPGVNLGRALFHRQTGSGLACASCHPEAREDGLVWDFSSIGKRRTQMVAGHLLARAPYHWDGDQVDLRTLMANVFTGRMSGGDVSRDELNALGTWLDGIPAPVPVVRDAAAVTRGRALFDSEEVGCASCHGGPLFTSNLRVAVGTGTDAAAFKVPSLVGVGARAPYLHDGCAATLADRFGPCGGGDLHGHTSQLSPAQLADLIAYLDSL